MVTEKRTREELESLNSKELKKLCKEVGHKLGGKKEDLVERILGPLPWETGETLNKNQLDQALAYFKFKKPEKASYCALKGLKKGYLNFKKGLDEVIFEETCQFCSEKTSCTLRELLNQPDYAGTEYEDGSESGALTCSNEDCEYPKMYLTGMCEGELRQNDGKSHNHCRDCSGLGKCVYDYRNAHCDGCGRHFFCGMFYGSCPRCEPEDDPYGGGFDGDNSDGDSSDGY